MPRDGDGHAAVIRASEALVVGIATVVGLGLALLAARGMQAFMFGVPGVDPVVLAAVLAT